MAMYLKSPSKVRAPKSPIASKDKKIKSPKRKRNLVSSFLKRFDNETVSSAHDLNTGKTVQDNKPSKLKIFSPKYEKTTMNNSEENDLLNSPPASPLKKRERVNEECLLSVNHIKQALWSSAYDEMDGFLFMKYAPLLPPDYFNNKKAVLPKMNHNKQYTLVLDLDETLVHCSVDKVDECDLIFPVVFNGDNYKVYMKKRPFFKQFLEIVQNELNFEVVIFTASQQCYADKLLNLVDPDKTLINYRLFRHHCINVEGNFVKDLRVLGRDLSKTIIIDNSPPAFTYQIDNGIPIVSWYDDKHDTELKYMIPLLAKLITLNDIRPAIKKYFKVKKLLKSLRM